MTYQSTLYVALVILGVFASSGLAFVSPTATQHQRCSGGGGLHMTADGRNASPYCRQQSILFSTPSEDDLSTSTEITVAKEESVEVPAPPAAAAEAPSEEEGTQYPLNVPSPLLLASAMLLAIISTGSVFQLSSGSPPPLGSAATAAIVIVGVPSCFFLLYAAILKGIAETEEDDKRFLSGK